MNAIASLPNISDAKLPVAYESAKKALSECASIDECKDWADKAAALASYAKQAKDDSMRKMAERIQARAIRRCGELLKQVEPATGGQPYQARSTQDAVVPSSRSGIATAAGLSERQRKTALRVANVPQEQFDAAVESDDPPTVTQLAGIGTQKKPQPLVDLGGIPPEDYAAATTARGTLRRFAEYCQGNEPTRIAKAFMPHEVSEMRSCVATVDQWLDKFVSNLPE